MAIFTLDRNCKELATAGVGGGRTYDAVIGGCARHAGAGALVTFNRRHFDPPPDGVSIVEPETRT